MRTEYDVPWATEPHTQVSDDERTVDERLFDLRRRRAEAADVLAETLLDMWLSERRAQPDAALRELHAGGRNG